MPDLVVDTSAQRAAAASLRAAVEMAGEAARRSRGLSAYVPAVGAHRPAQALSGFLHEWTYGMGLIRHDAEVLAGYLEAAADAYDAIERELARVAGGGAGPVPIAPPTVAVIADPPRRSAYADSGWASLPGAMPVTLANATHWRQLLPGEPDDLSTLASELRQFVAAAQQAGSGLRHLSTGGWQGRAATMFAGHIEETPAHLEVAGNAFAAASRALSNYAADLTDAQLDAAAAFRLWQDAEHRAQVARSTANIGAAPAQLTGMPSPEDDMARAAAILQRARDDMSAAGQALATVLDEAAEAAPNKPGLLASITRAISSFAGGIGEGTEGMVTGVASLVALSVKLTPAPAALDPDGYLDTLEAVLGGAQHMATHPTDTAKALVDWDTWADDPTRAAGRLVPDIVAALATAGGAGAAKATSATRRLDNAADEINRRGQDVHPRLKDAQKRERVLALGYDPDSPSGQAATYQVGAPYGIVDDWTDTTLKPGQRIAVGVGGPMSGFAVPITGDITASSARAWFESLQVAPMRVPEPGSPVPPPTVRPSVDIYELSSELPAATAPTLANTQFGAGGVGQIFLPGAPTHVADGSLIKVGEHHFDPATTRASIEDPRYRAVDPTLPDRPLDPAHEAQVGRVQGAAAGGTAATVTSHEHPPPTGAAP